MREAPCIVSIVGARPNFMKLVSVDEALRRRGVRHDIVHTGQHFDRVMSEEIIEDIGMRSPDYNLETGQGTPAEQMSRILERLPPILQEVGADWAIVYGDVTSTLGAALAARAQGVRVAHVEAGFRSFDRSMPEEVNRILVDHLADLCLTSHSHAADQLRREAVAGERIVTVGSTSLDLLGRMASRLPVQPRTRPLDPFAVCTLHRPGNVDDSDRLGRLLRALADLSARLPVIFSVHPRTAARLDATGFEAPKDLRLVPPLRYREFLALLTGASLLVTDSGGLQEEAAFLGLSALVLRDTTERPYLADGGWSRLMGECPEGLVEAAEEALASPRPAGYRDPWTDGKAGERVASALLAVGGIDS